MHVFFFFFSFFFFCKQKTAYEIEYGLVGSEMCIRDRDSGVRRTVQRGRADHSPGRHQHGYPGQCRGAAPCLLYTSDAADERSSVDLGGRRILKKKKLKKKKKNEHNDAQNRYMTSTS